MKINLDSPIDEVQIQIIPLIDVIFCILTFFIVAALQMTHQQAMNVDVPRASTGTTQTQESLVVSINSTGQTFIEKQFVDRNQLAQVFQEYFQKNPNGRLVLYASQTAFYNDVVQVLDLMRQVGGDRVALATVPLQPSQSPGATPSPTLNPTTSPLSPFSSPTPTSTFNSDPYQIPPSTGQTPNGFGSPTIAPTTRVNP
jgi:biopolymer transport protein ExbD